MKYLFLYFLLLCFYPVSGQKKEKIQKDSQAYYERKASTFKALANGSAGIGATSLVIGPLLYVSGSGTNYDIYSTYPDQKDKGMMEIGKTITYVGIGFALVSIPLYILAKKHRIKAKAIQLWSGTPTTLLDSNTPLPYVPTVGFKIHLDH